MTRTGSSIVFRAIATFVALAALAACASDPGRRDGGAPVAKPHYKVGSPYRVKGRLYRPAVDDDYDKIGIASWYGDAFHGRATANGEVFDKRRLTAAHTTLPLPSLVEVENLQNGKRLVVRVNDRGPFVDDRIIDLSEAAAEALGFAGAGLARVRVRFVGPAPLYAGGPAPSPRVATRTLVAPPPSRAQHRTAPPPNGPALDSDPIAALIADAPAPRMKPQPAMTANTMTARTGATNSGATGPAAAAPRVASTLQAVEKAVWIHAGSVADPDVARGLADQLSTIGPVRLVDAAVGGGHHIRLGPFGDRQEALLKLALVVERGYADARIVEPIVY